MIIVGKAVVGQRGAGIDVPGPLLLLGVLIDVSDLQKLRVAIRDDRNVELVHKAWHLPFDAKEIRHVDCLKKLDVLLVANLVERDEDVGKAFVRSWNHAELLVLAEIA